MHRALTKKRIKFVTLVRYPTKVRCHYDVLNVACDKSSELNSARNSPNRSWQRVQKARVRGASRQCRIDKLAHFGIAERIFIRRVVNEPKL